MQGYLALNTLKSQSIELCSVLIKWGLSGSDSAGTCDILNVASL